MFFILFLKMTVQKDFSVIARRGFQVRVNGFLISVMFGHSNYCSNKYNEEIGMEVPISFFDRVESDDVEIAVFNQECEFIVDWIPEVMGYDPCDQVVGHAKIEDFCRLIDWCIRNKVNESHTLKDWNND